MKVLMFHDFADLRGGANQYRLELTNLLRAQEFFVSLFTFNPGEDEGRSHVFRFNDGGLFSGRLRHHVFYPKLFSSLRKVIEDEKPDIVHVQGNHLFAHTVYLACSKGLPLVQTAHDIRLVCPNETGIRRNGIICSWSFGKVCVREGCITAQKYLAKAPSKIIIRSLFRKNKWRLISPSRALCENFGHFGLKPVLIPNFVDASSFDAHTSPSSSNTILFVGALYKSKGVDRLLGAFSEIHRRVKNVNLEIVGDGPEKHGLMEYARRLGIMPAVKFRGLLDPVGLRSAYVNSRMLVLPSVVKENCPLVVLEAMAAGRPVVASRIGGIPELVRDGETGILIPHNNDEFLADALMQLLEDKELADRMGSMGRVVVSEEFTPQRHLQSIVDLYGKMLDI